MEEMLGMPLDRVLENLSVEDAAKIRVTYTSARKEHPQDVSRTARVVRARDNTICAAYFRDGEPQALEGKK
ncbi:MAG: hypothetical protein PHQ85_03680 [Eubacteriales bacterium]|jgi:hypothetical protein|nr:hypothetical protein [Eubacteriales bacterium]MDD4104705.1 hypothetical protein [Eubacteriales bacterium]MDD4710285.1 hypothetical protein [Eubacteriales bacterium]NLO15276.1 hypothetical protein [Clostridiales bacterium]